MLHSLGYKDRHVAHGWRASFSTLAKDSEKFEKDVINLALDHIHDSEVARAYDRGQRWNQRIAVAKWWGEQLSVAEQGNKFRMRKWAAADKKLSLSARRETSATS